MVVRRAAGSPLLGIRPAGDVRAVLRQFVQPGVEIELFVGEIELAEIRLDVGFDVRDARQLGKFASDRSGTASSRHSGKLQADEPRVGRRRGLVRG
jgi:hypothetical protein